MRFPHPEHREGPPRPWRLECQSVRRRGSFAARRMRSWFLSPISYLLSPLSYLSHARNARTASRVPICSSACHAVVRTSTVE